MGMVTVADKKAVVLLSGGIDSATAMAIARSEGYEVYSLSFNYGQRHALELEAARRIAEFFCARQHLVLDIDLRAIGGSALTDNIDVPKGRSEGKIQHEIPATYVPARNTIFLSYALAWAEVLLSSDIFIGVNTIDYSGYPDCRPEYVAAFEKMAALATRAGVEGRPVRIHTPLMHLTKDAIIARGLELGVDYGLTRSCYDPDAAGAACRRCDSCRLRLAAFAKLGMDDPAPYVGS